MKRCNATITGGIFLAVVAFIAGLYVFRQMGAHDQSASYSFHGTVLTQPRKISHFELKGLDNQPFNNQTLQGQWTLLFFGFTQCGSVCPTTMAELKKMMTLLREQHVSPLPHVVMITLDPKRDSLKRLTQYVHAFDPAFDGARGVNPRVHALTQELGIAYTQVKGVDEEEYNIEHTGTLMLINPEGNLMAFFTTPHHAALIADDYKHLIL